MKAEDIIKQLQFALPNNSGLFTDEYSISNMFRISTTVTVVVEGKLTLKTGDFVNVVGTNTATPIVSMTNLGCSGDANTIEAISNSEVELTEQYNKTVTIVNAAPSEYNGSFTLLSTPLYNKFTFAVPKTVTTPITEFGNVLENRSYGYNGRFQITVISSNTFTYELDYDTPAPEFSNGVVRIRPRISGAVAIERAEDSYTKQQDNKYWAYVVLGDTVANKESTIETDSVYTHAYGQNFYQNLIVNFDVYIFAPSTRSISGRDIRDSMEDVMPALFKSILGVSLPYQLTNQGKPDNNSTVTFVSQGFEAYMDAYYIHRFTFSTTIDLNSNDITPISQNAPFKKMHIDYINDNIVCDEIEMTSDIEFEGVQTN